MQISWSTLLRRPKITPTKKNGAALCEILTELMFAKRDLMIALNNFDFAINAEMVDLFSHQITLAQARYDYIILRARAANISFDNHIASNIICKEK